MKMDNEDRRQALSALRELTGWTFHVFETPEGVVFCTDGLVGRINLVLERPDKDGGVDDNS